MNTRLLSPRARASGATTRRLWHFNFLGITLLFCIGIGGLLVPAKNETRDRRLPAHQLAADARTLGAALRYLFVAEEEATSEVTISATGRVAIAEVSTLPSQTNVVDRRNGEQIFTNASGIGILKPGDNLHSSAGRFDSKAS